MMDTCADYYNNLSGNSTTAAHASVTPKSGVDDHHAAVENLTSHNPSNIHPLLQHNTHPQHLIAPVAPQLVVPPSAIVAPTITTNHHPQQPTKFTHNGATSYSTSTAAGAQQSSVVHGTSSGNGGGQLQATVYPIQHQPPKNLSPAASPLESLKASVITENPFEAYHHNQQNIQEIQGNYQDSANSWTNSVVVNNRSSSSSSDHHSGYLDPSRNLYSGNVSSNCALLGNEYNNLNGSYSENVGYASNNNTGYPSQNFGGTIGVGFAATPSNLSQTDGQSAIYQTNQESGTKCTYNNSSSPVISNQTATSPFQYINNNINSGSNGTIQQTSFSNSAGSNTGAMLQGMANGSVSSSSSRSANYGTMNGHSQMRSNPNHHSSSFDLNATGPLDYQTHQHYPVPNGHTVDLPRTYLDLSASSKSATNHPYYPSSQGHVVPPVPQQKSKRFGLYDNPAPQYVDPNYAYNAHPSLGQMSMHANQLSRSVSSSSSSSSHYNRSSAGQGVPQMDPKYRRSSSGSGGFSVYKGDGAALKVPPHLSYHHPHHPQYGSYTTDPMTGKRIVNYPPTSHHQPIANGYSEQIYADLESAKKKAGYPGKYPYSYMAQHHPPTAGSGQYGLMGTNIPSATMQRANYYPNGFVNYAAHQPPTAVMNGYNGAGYYPSAMNPQPPAGSAPGADYYGHSNFIKSHSSAHVIGPKSTMEAHQLDGKYNRNCYYETNVPPAGEKTYVDLEDQISGSKITKARNGYPMDYHPHHHQAAAAAAYYDVHHPPVRHPGIPYANSKYCQDPRYLYHPHQSHPQAAYYTGGVDGSGTGIAMGMGSHPSQSHLGHHMLRPHMSMQGTTQSQAGYGDNGKKTNVRDFLSSWNDDEDEIGGTANSFGDNYSTFNGMASSLHSENMQRIQVGISIDKSTLMDSTGTMNLPDIIIDIEKQKPAIPEIDLTDDGQEEGATAGSAVPEERLYVLESIDVPLSELNKYKHLNVINKLPENIVHLKDNGGGVESVFNESDLIHAGEGEVMKVAGDSAVENSLKFIEEIESNSDFKNDFELNVEYESFPNKVKEDVAGEVKTEPAAASPGESLASLAVKAEDLVAAGGQRKESVIVAMKRKEKGESGRKKKKFRKALKAQLKLLQEQRLKEERAAGGVNNREVHDEDNCEVDGLPPKSAFKSLVKCCLDVINTKQFRRNATKYLTVADVQVPSPTKAQEESPVPRHYRYLRRFRESAKLTPTMNPKSLREMCAEVVIAWNMVTIQEEDDDDNMDEGEVQIGSGGGLVRLIDGQVPLLRELCENVLQQTNFIINVDDFCHLGEDEENSKPFSQNNNELDDNNNNNDNNTNIPHMTLISGLSPQENLEALIGDRDQHPEEEVVDHFDLNPIPSPDAAPSAYLFHDNHQHQEDALMNCDYFLATADQDSDQIQFSEEVVPVDADRHKRQLLTEQLRAKYVHNSQNIHALDSRRMILKKYFYYQKHVAMVRRWRRRRRWNGSMNCGDSFVVALRKRYQCAMRFRQRWMKKSKSILIEPQATTAKAGEVSQRPPAMLQAATQIVIRPRAAPPAPTETLSNSDKIMELIKGGIADMARKSAAREEHSRGADKNDTTEVIMVTVEKTRLRRDDDDEKQRRRRRRRSRSRRSSRDSRSDRKKYKESREEKRERSESVVVQQKDKEKKNGLVGDEREKIDSHPRRSAEEVKEHQRTTPILFNESRKEEMRIRKKIKPKFDDILLGIDDIYKTSINTTSSSSSLSSSSASTANSMKMKPKTSLRALRAFENVDESSMSSPSSVVSSSTSASTSSCSSASTSSSTNSSKSSKSSKNTTSDSEVSRGVSSSLSSTSKGSTVSRSISSSSSSSSSKSRKCGSKGTKMESESKGMVNQTTTTTKVNVRVKSSKLTITATGGGPRVEKKRKSEADLMVSLKEKLIIKKAVVQLERDGFIDKLGKLYT